MCAESCGEAGYAIACRWCGEWFVVCVRHYRRQGYCGDECRKLARRVQANKAQATYLKKLKGKQCRAKASAGYRERRAKGLPSRGPPAQIVIDQALPRRPSGKQHAPPRRGTCAVCGCRCRVIAIRK